MEAAMWQASRYGLGGDLVDAVAHRARPAADVVAQLLDHVSDGLAAHGDGDLVRGLVGQIMERGNGAMRQRAAQAAGGERALLSHIIGFPVEAA
jgi:carboxylate-amine ligase